MTNNHGEVGQYNNVCVLPTEAHSPALYTQSLLCSCWSRETNSHWL